ncbi:hypothetical protein CP533_4524 [Ophiocordyceps camponoti-saundersi (nom. inval.)]|nr:hypothetical protein CP533_4524 [Ophiocordyceps camponoti-saundersi (nom. inval.)]
MRGFAVAAVVMWFASGVLAAPTTTNESARHDPASRVDRDSRDPAGPRPLVRRQSGVSEDAARKAGSQTSRLGRRRSMETEKSNERREVEVELLNPPPRPRKRSTDAMTKEVVHHKAAQ